MTGTVPRDRHRASSSTSTDPGGARTPRTGAPAERLAALLAEAAPGTAPGDPADTGSAAGLRTAGPAGTAGPGTAAGTGSTAGTGRDRPGRSGTGGSPAAEPAHRWETTARTRIPPSLLLLATAAVAGLAWAVLGPGASGHGPGEDGGTALAEVGVPASPAPDAAGPVPDAAASGAAPGASATVPAATDGSLHVHVAGEVARPGVVELEPGARVVDAVEAAGGLTDAAAGTVNLAAPVTDGQQVLVPDAAAAPPAPAAAAAVPAAGSAVGSAAGGGDAAGGAVPNGPLNLNTATAADLEALPRVGPVLAGRIVEFRDQHGGFTAAGDLDAVPGIGPALMEALLPLVTV